MRLKGWLAISIFAPLLGAGTAAAEPGGGGSTVEQPGIGRLETRVQSYGGALGVVSRLVRPRTADVECNAVCYYPSSSSKPVAWKCAPKKPCMLHCLVNPPVGGCD